MSWLKNTISKVRESGEALKQSETLSKLREKTSTAVASVKSRASGGGPRSCSTAADLGAQLEQGASNMRKAAGLSDLHKAWVQQIGASSSKEGQSYPMEDSEKLLSFKEVLLRSRALELTVEAIVSDATLRASYSEPPTSEDKTSPVALLYALLSKTLSVPTNLWSEVLRLAMCSDGLHSDGHVAWLMGAISAMKIDWREEMLTAERKEMALRAEYLRQEIKQLESQHTADESDTTYQRRVAASSEMLQTYQTVRRNLEDAESHRSQTRETKAKDLGHIIEQIQAHMIGLQSSAQTSSDRQKSMEGDLKQSQDSIQLQLQNMTDARTPIDRELEELEERKRQLKIELDQVSQQLDAARTKQRQHMENCDKQRNELDSLKTSVKDKIEAEVSIIQRAESDRSIIERTQQLVRDTDGVVQKALGGQLDELRKKQVQFNDHFQELLKEHLTHLEVQVRHLSARGKSDSSSPEPPIPALPAAESAQEDFDKFVSEYGDLLTSGESQAKVGDLRKELAALQKMLAPFASQPTTVSAETSSALDTKPAAAAGVPSFAPASRSLASATPAAAEEAMPAQALQPPSVATAASPGLSAAPAAAHVPPAAAAASQQSLAPLPAVPATQAPAAGTLPTTPAAAEEAIPAQALQPPSVAMVASAGVSAAPAAADMPPAVAVASQPSLAAPSAVPATQAPAAGTLRTTAAAAPAATGTAAVPTTVDGEAETDVADKDPETDDEKQLRALV